MEPVVRSRLSGVPSWEPRRVRRICLALLVLATAASGCGRGTGGSVGPSAASSTLSGTGSPSSTTVTTVPTIVGTTMPGGSPILATDTIDASPVCLRTTDGSLEATVISAGQLRCDVVGATVMGPDGNPICAPDQLGFTIDVSPSATASPGQSLTITATIVNNGPTACDVAYNSPEVLVFDSDERLVWAPGGLNPGHFAAAEFQATLGPTESTAVLQAPLVWSQDTCGAASCGGPPVPSGTYELVVGIPDLGAADRLLTISTS